MIALSDRSEPAPGGVGQSPSMLLAKPFDVFVLLEHLARAVQQARPDGGCTTEGSHAD